LVVVMVVVGGMAPTQKAESQSMAAAAATVGTPLTLVSVSRMHQSFSLPLQQRRQPHHNRFFFPQVSASRIHKPLPLAWAQQQLSAPTPRRRPSAATAISRRRSEIFHNLQWVVDKANGATIMCNSLPLLLKFFHWFHLAAAVALVSLRNNECSNNNNNCNRRATAMLEATWWWAMKREASVVLVAHNSNY
jgi:hypothetical protein